jgi:hypothetical protein
VVGILAAVVFLEDVQKDRAIINATNKKSDNFLMRVLQFNGFDFLYMRSKDIILKCK